MKNLTIAFTQDRVTEEHQGKIIDTILQADHNGGSATAYVVLLKDNEITIVKPRNILRLVRESV
mgnify:CR=1 FL=1